MDRNQFAGTAIIILTLCIIFLAYQNMYLKQRLDESKEVSSKCVSLLEKTSGHLINSGN